MHKTVFIVGNFLSASGGSRGVCEELAERLTSAGWKVLTASHKPARFARLVDMLVTAVSQRHKYAVAQIDVFSGPAFFWAEAVCWVLQRLGKPCVLTLHGGNLPQFSRRWPRRVARLLRSSAIVTAPSAYLQQTMQPYRSDIQLLANPVNISTYPFRERRPVQPRLAWLRAFDEIYNPVLAVKVVAALLPSYPDVHLSMVGPDKRDGSLQKTKAKVSALGLEGQISFPGQIPKLSVPSVLAKADIFLNTTNFDNTPVSVIEAMACGLCVVSTDVGGMPYLVTPETDGLLVAPADERAMVAAVVRVLKEPSLAARLSRNARSKAEQFDWNGILPQWEALLSNLIAANSEKCPVKFVS